MKRRTAALLILLLLAVGCRGQRASEPPSQAVPAPLEAATAAPAEAAQYAVTFTAQTLEGETVTESFLGQYDLTMVNVWASWCGPCRSELSALGELYDSLPENVGFLSVTVDGARDLQTAASLLEQNGCAFPCLDGDGSASLKKAFLSRVLYIPTTLFLDRNGNEVGQWIVGVPRGSAADAYRNEIQARLDQLSGK